MYRLFLFAAILACNLSASNLLAQKLPDDPSKIQFGPGMKEQDFEVVKNQMFGSPYWEVVVALDEKTGIIKCTVKNKTEKTITLDVSKFFSQDPNLDESDQGFDLKYHLDHEKNGEDEFEKTIKYRESLKHINTRWVGGSASFSGDSSLYKEKDPTNRILNLEKGESFSKEWYLWDLYKWRYICRFFDDYEVFDGFKTAKFELTKRIEVKVEGKEISEVLYGMLIIDHKLIQRMKRLEKAYRIKHGLPETDSDDLLRLYHKNSRSLFVSGEM